MKAIQLAIIVTIISALASPVVSLAVDDLKISINCPDVVLRWPSKEGETYIIEHRTTLDTNTPWRTLTTDYPASTGTNLTYYVHPDQVPCPPGQIFGMMSAMRSGSESSRAVYTSALFAAVMAGDDSYVVDTPPMPPVRVGKEFVPWEKVHSLVLPTVRQISKKIRSRILERLAEKAVSRSLAAEVSDEISGAENLDGPNGNDPQRQDAGGGGGEPTSGFYQVKSVRVTGGLTNAMSASDLIDITVRPEIGLEYLRLAVDGRSTKGAELLIPPFTNGPIILSFDTTATRTAPTPFR